MSQAMTNYDLLKRFWNAKITGSSWVLAKLSTQESDKLLQAVESLRASNQGLAESMLQALGI